MKLSRTASVRACQPKTKRAPPLLCVIQKTPCTSRPRLSNTCIGTCCAFLCHALRRVRGAFLVASRLCSSILLETLLRHVRRKIRHAEKDLSQISVRSIRAQNRHLHHISGPRCHLETVLPTAWRELSASLRSSCSDTVQTCLPENRCQHLLLREIVLLSLLRHSVDQPKRRIMTSSPLPIAIGTISSLCVRCALLNKLYCSDVSCK